MAMPAVNSRHLLSRLIRSLFAPFDTTGVEFACTKRKYVLATVLEHRRRQECYEKNSQIESRHRGAEPHQCDSNARGRKSTSINPGQGKTTPNFDPIAKHIPR